MTLTLYLLDPDPSPGWIPFAGVRPLAELRAGAHLVRERWETFVGTETAEIFALPHLTDFAEAGVPPVIARHAVRGPAVIGSSTFAPRGLAPALPAEAFRLVCRGITVGWGVPAGGSWEGPRPEARPVEVEGLVLHGVHDCVRALETLLRPNTCRRVLFAGGGWRRVPSTRCNRFLQGKCLFKLAILVRNWECLLRGRLV